MTEAAYWRQKYEVLMANFSDMARAAAAPTPVLLADKESYELGKLHGEIAEREACALIANSMDPLQDGEIGKAIRARGQA